MQYHDGAWVAQVRVVYEAVLTFLFLTKCYTSIFYMHNKNVFGSSKCKCILLQANATPAVEAFHECLEKGKEETPFRGSATFTTPKTYFV